MEQKLCLDVWPEMGKRLGIGRVQAYELVHREDFPKIVLGRRILVPIAGLEKWIEAQAGGYISTNDAGQ